VKVCEDIERLIEAIVSGIPGSQVSTGSPGQRPQGEISKSAPGSS
jgi:hypothetical protein